MNIIKRIADDCHDFWNAPSGRTYVSDEVLCFSRCRGPWESLWIFDLTHAMRAGKRCLEVKIEWHRDEGFQEVQTFLKQWDYQLRPAMEAINALPFPPKDYPPVEIGPLKFFRGGTSGVRRFSPWVKPNALPEAPKKWTVPHVVRALLNGQFKKLTCNGVYSDDYAYDAAVNFRQGPIANAAAFACRILESPSGWWASNDGDRVSICCHHFDSNSFVFVAREQQNPGLLAA